MQWKIEKDPQESTYPCLAGSNKSSPESEINVYKGIISLSVDVSADTFKLLTNIQVTIQSPTSHL